MTYYSGSAADRQSRRAVVAQDIGQWNTPLPNLLGADLLPTGNQRLDLSVAHLARRRARDYTWASSFPLELIGQDALAAGLQVTDLPPRALARARDYSLSISFPLTLIGQDLLPSGTQTAALPPKGAARSRDYTVAAAFPLSLIGQEQFTAGVQSLVNPVTRVPRGVSLGEPGVNLTVLLPVVSAALPDGKTSLPTDLPPRGALRARDYTWLATVSLELLGQDTMAPGRSSDATALPPRGPARSRDYTWIQSLPLHVFQQLPPGQSTTVTEGPPRGRLRARDYTYLDTTRRHLIGQDTVYGAPGQVPAYDWQLPVPRRPRSRDYTWLQIAPYGDGSAVTARDLAYVVGLPNDRWATGPINDRWRTTSTATSG